MQPFLLVAIILGSTADVGFTRDFANADMCEAARGQILQDLGPALQENGRHASIRCVLREMPVSALEAEQRREEARLLGMTRQTPAEAAEQARLDAEIQRNKRNRR